MQFNSIPPCLVNAISKKLHSAGSFLHQGGKTRRDINMTSSAGGGGDLVSPDTLNARQYTRMCAFQCVSETSVQSQGRCVTKYRETREGHSPEQEDDIMFPDFWTSSNLPKITFNLYQRKKNKIFVRRPKLRCTSVKKKKSPGCSIDVSEVKSSPSAPK